MAGVVVDSNLPVIEDLQQLLVSGAPMIDTRAPVEYAAGAFASAVNLPLMDDGERQAVGKCYKKNGQDAAIELGLELVSGPLKQERINRWTQFVKQNPEGVLYCFRGGLRSRITQQWIYEQTGIRYPRVQGGYKAMRRYLLQQLDSLPERYQAIVLSGRTGSGKTRFLTTFQQQVDLEALANHRGSAFGPQVTPQPVQIDFEHALAIRLLRQVDRGCRSLLFEDESQNIGSVHLPQALLTQLRSASLVMLETTDEERVEISFQEYVVDMVLAFNRLHESEGMGFQAFSDYILGSLMKIRNRLGGVRFAEVDSMMRTALVEQGSSGSLEKHRDWVRFILLDYYDPMYDYQISKKQERLVFKGSAAEVRDYLTAQGIN